MLVLHRQRDDTLAPESQAQDLQTLEPRRGHRDCNELDALLHNVRAAGT